VSIKKSQFPGGCIRSLDAATRLRQVVIVGQELLLIHVQPILKPFRYSIAFLIGPQYLGAQSSDEIPGLSIPLPCWFQGLRKSVEERS